MTNITALPITEEEFRRWQDSSLANYAIEKSKEGLSEADARAEAAASFERHLGKGKDSPNHHIYSVSRTDTGARVGTLWWGVQKQGTQSVAWIYDIVLDPEFRGQGLGRKTMEWAMADAKSKGFARLGLHVFGHNRAARGLYEALGFEITNLVMYRNL